ncbi:hypothetical protein D3C72_247120 [compost metagenome]
MNKSNDIKNHRSSYAVMMWNDGDAVTNAEYFLKEEDSVKVFEDSDKTYDNVHLYQLVRCSETIEE